MNDHRKSKVKAKVQGKLLLLFGFTSEPSISHFQQTRFNIVLFIKSLCSARYLTVSIGLSPPARCLEKSLLEQYCPSISSSLTLNTGVLGTILAAVGNDTEHAHLLRHLLLEDMHLFSFIFCFLYFKKRSSFKCHYFCTWLCKAEKSTEYSNMKDTSSFQKSPLVLSVLKNLIDQRLMSCMKCYTFFKKERKKYIFFSSSFPLSTVYN